MAPYFDEELAALARLAANYPQARVDVLVQPAGCTVNPERVGGLPGRVRFFDVGEVRGNSKQRFFHAKGIILETEKAAWCLVGSANVSLAALYSPPGQGNAELCVLQRDASPDHFRSVLGIGH